MSTARNDLTDQNFAAVEALFEIPKSPAPKLLTVADYAYAKNLPEDYLRNTWGLTDSRAGIIIPYHNQDGTLFRNKSRRTLGHEDSNGEPWAKWLGKSKTSLPTTPYGLDRVAANTPELLMVEGESCTQTAWFHDVSTIGISGSEGLHDEFAKFPAFAETKTIYVLREPGEGGDKFVAKAAKSPLREKMKILTLPEGIKDISELHLQNPNREAFRAALKESIAAAKLMPVVSVETKPVIVADLDLVARNAATFESHLTAAGIRTKRERYEHGNFLYKWIISPCPFNPAHTSTSAAVFMLGEGTFKFVCKHKSCAHKKWPQFVEYLAKRLGKPFVFEEANESVAGGVEEYEAANTTVSTYPQMGDDLISQYARLLTQGTGIPFGHVRECLKNFLAFCLGDSIHYPGHEKLYLRGWHFNLGEPETAKTTALTEIVDRWARVLTDLGIWIDKLSSYGSLQYLTKGFEDHERMLLYVTEGNTLANANEHIPAIFGGLSDLYDQPVISAGSYRNKSAKCVKAKGSCLICVTPDDFIKAMQGKGVIGGGVLPRWTMSHSDKVPIEGNWPSPPEERLSELQSKMLDRFNGVSVIESVDAKAIRVALTKEIERPEAGRHGKRLIEHYKRECLLAAVFADPGDVGIITKEVAEWAATWTRYQLHLRIVYWPIDAGNDVERMCSAMRALLKRAHPKGVSLKNLKDAANVYREGSGGIEAFGRAYRAMMANEDMRKIGQNIKGKDLFGLMGE